LAEPKPNIKSLVRGQDVEGLLKAASYRDLTPSSAGTLRDRGIPVRADAVLALGMLAPVSGLGAIRARLADPAEPVRCAAVRVLHALGEAGVLAQSLRSLPPNGSSARALAARAIVDLRKSVRPSAVTEALVHRDDDDPLGEHDAGLILALLEEEGAAAMDDVLEMLVLALDHERKIVVDRAAEMLVRLAPESIAALAAELHTGPNPAGAAYVLGRIGDPQTMGVLAEALEHSDARVRAESVAALADTRDPAAAELLLQATGDPEHSVRTRAGVALDQLGASAMVVGIAAALEPMIREAARSGILRADVEADGGPPEAESPPPTAPPDPSYASAAHRGAGLDTSELPLHPCRASLAEDRERGPEPEAGRPSQ
jgi:HEAT repeat protein